MLKEQDTNLSITHAVWTIVLKVILAVEKVIALCVPLFAALRQSATGDLQIKAVGCQHRVPAGKSPLTQFVLEVQDWGGSTDCTRLSHSQPVVLKDKAKL